MNKTELKNLIREEIKNVVNEQKLNEDIALVGDIALGVAGGLVGLFAVVAGGTAILAKYGEDILNFADRMEAKSKAAVMKAKKQGRIDTIKPIVDKFKNDTKLQAMYKALPEYDNSANFRSGNDNKERTKQMQDIAKYIKSKLTADEMQYFYDVSSMLRTGDIK